MTPKARKDDLVIQEMENELLVYDLIANKANCLSSTSASIWQACDGDRSVSEIVEILEEKLGCTVSEDFVLFAIEQLKSADLLEVEGTYSNVFEGLSRREIFKKLGLATAVALPIVSSLVVPMAVHAISCPAAGTGMADIPAGSGCPCVQPQDCTGGSCMGSPGTC